MSICTDDSKAYNGIRSKVLIHPGQPLPYRGPYDETRKDWMIPPYDDGCYTKAEAERLAAECGPSVRAIIEPWPCESHPDRFFPQDEPMLSATVHEPPGVYDDNIGEDGFEIEGWDIIVTRSGWAFGDSRCEIALCPQCASEQYRPFEEAQA